MISQDNPNKINLIVIKGFVYLLLLLTFEFINLKFLKRKGKKILMVYFSIIFRTYSIYNFLKLFSFIHAIRSLYKIWQIKNKKIIRLKHISFIIKLLIHKITSKNYKKLTNKE
jgi:hypothetical protein